MTRKEAIEFLKNMIDRESIGFVCPKGDGDVAVWEYHVTALNMAIKALEQPEIIRCRDCKHWLPHEQFGFDEANEEYHDYCEKLIPEDEYYAFYRDADDFCSYAEREEGEE